MKTDSVKPPHSSSKESTFSKKQLRPDAPAFVPFQKILENLLLYQQLHAADKEPQCSRYSRKSIRVSLDANTSPVSHEQQENVSPDGEGNPASPRPILGNAKTVSPRAILGRKENLMASRAAAAAADGKVKRQKIAKDDEKKLKKEEPQKREDEEEEEDDDDDGLANMGKEYRSVYRRIQRLKMSDDAANKKTISNINAAIQLRAVQTDVWAVFPRERLWRDMSEQ